VVDQSLDNPKKLALRDQASDDIQLWEHVAERVTLMNALWNLAWSLTGSQSVTSGDEFIKAYVNCGTVVNPYSAKRSRDEDIHSRGFVQLNRGSHRSATMPRDYIFATMPSFPWYVYPKKDALSMSFGEIYLDLYQQAERSGHAFTCRFTRSMLDSECIDPTDGWLPSQRLPSPTTLGDFLKLVGHRVPEASNASSPHVHVTSAVSIRESESQCSPEIVIARLEACFEQSRRQWLDSYHGGELSKFGSHPDHRWRLDHADATRSGWVPIDPEYAARVYDDGHHTRTRIDLGLVFEEGDCLVDVSSLEKTEQEAHMSETGKYVPLFVQARRILSRIQHAGAWRSNNGAQETVWEDFKQRMQGLWSLPLLRTMLLLAGMVNCRIPLSAVAWVNKLFVPVHIRHSEDLLAVGLLAKHARQPKHQRQDPLPLLCVGQHLPFASRKAFGMDLFLVDPETKVPVGLVPDIGSDYLKDEEFVKAALPLYNGCRKDLGDNKVEIIYRPLSNEPSVPRETYVVGPQ